MKHNLNNTVWIFLTALTISACQKHQSPETTTTESGLCEWYLKTKSNWYSTPRLYVKEVGRGSDTVIMIHGGWGAEHSYFPVKGLESGLSVSVVVTK